MKRLIAGLALAALAGAAAAQTQPQAPSKTDQAPQTAAGAAAASKPQTAALSVGRSAVCTGIKDREPSGTPENAEFKAEVGMVYFWTEIIAKDVPTTVKHRWALGGKQAAEIELAVKHPKTRTWSAKKIAPGSWKVEALSPDGEVMKAVEFKVVP